MMVKMTLRDYLQTTEEAINSGRLDEALSSCQRILAQYPDSLEAQRLLGEIYLAQDQFEQARQTFDWILVNDPENVLVYCDRAIMSEKLADIDTALDCYQQAYELSRGNRDIRQQFNQLSARVGQQGFMLSRAGLARLYMRGDLLSQAIQEWETVLSTTPDRLDARTGLMEACWREGLYERTEELASQLLEEYPSNLKALLLLAYTTSIHNMPRAQELLQRAQSLDPDLLITQELFRELAINQPADPFLPLLKKEPSPLQDGGAAPASLPPSTPAYPSPEASSSQRENTPIPAQGGDPLIGWHQSNGFSDKPRDTPSGEQEISEISPAASINQDPWNQANQDEKTWQPYSSFSGISSEPGSTPEQGQSNMPSNDPAWYHEATHFNENSSMDSGWNNQDSGNEPDNHQTFHSTTSSGTTNHRTNAPAWLDMLNVNDYAQANDMAPEAPTDFKPAPASERTPTPAPEIEQKTPAPQPETRPATKPEPEEQTEEPSPFFFGDDESETDMSWPEWLKSLGAAEIDPNQPSTTMAPITPEDIEQYKQAEADRARAESASGELTSQPQSQPNRVNPDSAFNGLISQPLEESRGTNPNSTFTDQPSSQPLEQITNVTPSAQPEQSKPEEFTTSYEPLSPEEFSPVLSSESLQRYTPDNAQPNPGEYSWQQQLEHSDNTPQEPNRAAEAPQTYGKAQDETEQHLLATLESLEQNLLSQGFVPMTGSLSHLAQQLDDQPASPTLSSAFAELGASESTSAIEPQASDFSTWHEPIRDVAEEETVEKTIDPLVFRPPSDQSYQPAQENPYSTWQPEQAPETPAYSPYAGFEQQQQNFTAQPAWQQAPDVQPQQPAASQPALEQTPGEPQNDLEKTLSAYYTETSQHQAIKKPEATDSSTESTVTTDSGKIPAYRNDALLDGELETTMKRPAIRLQSIHQRGHGDRSQSLLSRARSANQLAAGNVSNSNKDRLLRGYQCQLSGAYDEAMGEYRIVIRNAPELLGEVISNMRALLKLAPKYAAGYRVLGDAYMRQGEYLQAMEAYNKALTMTKKAKGN